MLKDDHETLPPQEKFEGYVIDLIASLSKKIENFQYEITISPQNKFGSERADGSWDGMIGEILAGVKLNYFRINLEI